MNYRSAVVFGRGRLLPDDEKWAAMELFSEKIMPGRWHDARQPGANEVKATSIVAVAIESASAKTRTGPPGDDEEDYDLPVWAGVLPLSQRFGAPQADARLPAGVNTPAYVQDYLESRHRQK